MVGCLFEIRREVNLSTVNDNDGQPLMFYPQDLANIAKEAKIEQETTERERVKQLQEQKIEAKEEFETGVGFEIEGS